MKREETFTLTGEELAWAAFAFLKKRGADFSLLDISIFDYNFRNRNERPKDMKMNLIFRAKDNEDHIKEVRK